MFSKLYYVKILIVINKKIARIFSEIADILEINDENPFRIRSYRNAAITLENLSEDIDALYKEGNLNKIQGIGSHLAEKIEEIIKTGSCKDHQKLLKSFPHGLIEMLRIPYLGPKKVKKLYKELGIKTIEELREAARKGKLGDLEGFGITTEEKILHGIDQLEESKGRFLISEAAEYANLIIEKLKKLKEVERIEIAGSLRRGKETIGDLDILVESSKPDVIMDIFTEQKEVKEIVAKGLTKSSVILENDLKADLRVVKKESFGAAWMYFTGSKEHNVVLRTLAKKKSLKISEYGIFKEGKKEIKIGGGSEEEIYRLLDMAWIPAELRENRGEIEAAKNNNLPKLIERKYIKGDLHTHTIASDGSNTILEMAKAAQNLGYEYMAITDHSQKVSVAGGLSEKELLKQFKDIDLAEKKIKGFKIFKGVEVDILNDGSLDIKDEVLKKADFVIAAIHYKFEMSEEDMTDRIIKGFKNPFVIGFAHPTGRMLKKREGYKVNMNKIIEAAALYNVALEINANPVRLDLLDIYCKMAKEKGVKIYIATDAHSTQDLLFMDYGVQVARRGWLEKSDIINTYSLPKFLKLIRKKR